MTGTEANDVPDREAYLEVLGLMTFSQEREMRTQLGNPKWDIAVSRLPVLLVASVHMLNTFADMLSEFLDIDREQFMRETAIGLAADNDT